MAPEDTLNAYLDGELVGADLADFERALDSDAQLRARVERMRKIEGTLCKIHAADSVPSVTNLPKKTAISWQRALPYAALVAIGVGIWFFTSTQNRPDPLDGSGLYQRTVVLFEPQKVCDTPAKFEQYTLEAFGRTISADFDAGVALIGWRTPRNRYEPDSEDGPRVLLARSVNGTEVLAVFQDPSLPAPRVGSDLNRFDRRVGPVRVFEITPLDEPEVIGLLTTEG